MDLNSEPSNLLKRELGTTGAVYMGLGAMIGTGIFVSIGIAAGIAGPAVLLAILIAAGVATCNALSSAQLASDHSVSGGTYEYGYRYLNPYMGFTAGWMFLVAKAASAATAALGFSGYLLYLTGWPSGMFLPVAVAAIVLLSGVVLAGMKRSNQVNLFIVSLTLLALLFFLFIGLFSFQPEQYSPFLPLSFDGSIDIGSILFATALMFVAYTGYGRIATLGEEVRFPKKTIPKAIVITMIVTLLLYLLTAIAGLNLIGAGGLAEATDQRAAPLAVAAAASSLPGSGVVLSAGAITAMLGVLLNLIIGLSRVLLAMGRRKDLPPSLAFLNKERTTPVVAVVVTCLGISGLAMIGDVQTTWSFSAFTVLIYYSITNLAALKLSPGARIFPRWISVAGLISCLFLAFWVETTTWLAGLLLIALGLKYFFIVNWYRK